MNRFSGRPFLRLALIGAFVAALGLAACGRKGPLDPPPSTLVNGEKSAPETGKDKLSVGSRGQPMAPKGPERRIPLDVLLN